MRNGLSALIWALLLVVSAGAVFALGLPENVLVVQNTNSPVSQRLAAYYMAARSIPAGNLVTLNVPDAAATEGNESVSPSYYTANIEQPIRTFLANNSLTNKIQFIVLTKGIPLHLDYDFTGGPSGGQSVDGMLAAIDVVNPITLQFEDENHVIVATMLVNRYWRSHKPFTHSEFGGYLVTRLDGYTESDAKALVDRAMAPNVDPYTLLLDTDASKGYADPSIEPRWILLPDGSFDPQYTVNYDDYNADMVKTSMLLTGRLHTTVTLDQSTAFVGSGTELDGYYSWGSNDASYSQTTYNSLTFGPRSIAETAVSTSARSMFKQTTGQSQIPDLISQGAAGAKGYVTEPYLDAVASPSVLFDYYTSGRNLAESFYAASRLLQWKDVVLGEPLCQLSGTTVSKVSQAKSVPDGTLVSIMGKSVSAGTDDFGDRFYIEEDDRSSGIMVYIGESFSGVLRGTVVSVRGVMDTVNGERAIVNPSIVGTSVTLGAAPLHKVQQRITRPRLLLPARPLKK